MIAVQDHTATLYHPEGINIPDLLAYQKQQGAIKGFDMVHDIDKNELWNIEADIFIPAALEGVISKEIAQKLQTKLILEGANGPTDPAADDVLNERGIVIVPDVICNAGGVTVSYFEWVQDLASYFWTEDEINHRMDVIMRKAIHDVWDRAQHANCSLRTAAYIVACERILLAAS